jgi:thioredoxin 1
MTLFRARGSEDADRVAAILARLVQASRGRLGVIEIDVEAGPTLAARYNVTETPTILLVRDGEVVDRVIGAATRILLQSLLDARAPRPVSAPLSSRRRTRPSSASRNTAALATR